MRTSLSKLLTGQLGSIGDLFTSLGGQAADLGEQYGQLKERIRPPPEVVEASMRRLEAEQELAI